MSNRVSQLEYTVLELGAEVYRLKHEVKKMTSTNEMISSAFNKLRNLLDDKLIIDSDEFDIQLLAMGAVDLDTDTRDVEVDPVNKKMSSDKDILH